MDILPKDPEALQVFEELVQSLINSDYSISDNFLPQKAISGLRSNIQNFSRAGQTHEAGLSNQLNHHNDRLIRGDKIRWIEDDSKEPNELLFLSKIKYFVDYLNNTCYTSIKGFEAHYASYGPHSFYKRHLDQFRSDKGRKFFCYSISKR